MKAILLKKDIEQKLTRSIQRYLIENFGEDIGQLKASLFLKYCLEEIAPSVYNLAIAERGLTLLPEGFLRPLETDALTRIGRLVAAGVYARMWGEDIVEIGRAHV